MTKTTRFVAEAKPLAEKHVPHPYPNHPPNREGICRLGFHLSKEIAESTTAQLASSIKDSSLADAIIMLDTNIFTKPMVEHVWDAILTRHLAITPMVWQELAGGPKPWRTTTPCCNGRVRDLLLRVEANCRNGCAETDARVDIEWLALDDAYLAHGYQYYVDLLALRKRIGPLYQQMLTSELGRAPTNDEFAATVRRQLGERGLQMAKEGLEKNGSPNLITDEQLVVMAFLTAIMRGREVIIITRDSDVYEQFFKLLYLVGGHYRGMLAAQTYAADPLSMPFKSIPANALVHQDFEGEEILWHLTHDGKFSNVLPRPHHFVMVYCWLLHTDDASMQDGKIKTTQAAFCAETEMAPSLQVKARTGGLNTDKLEGRNCVPAFLPLAHKATGDCAIGVFIGKEKRFRLGSWDFPIFRCQSRAGGGGTDYPPPPHRS